MFTFYFDIPNNKPCALLSDIKELRSLGIQVPSDLRAGIIEWEWLQDITSDLNSQGIEVRLTNAG